jgi:GAF domain-containing protein
MAQIVGIEDLKAQWPAWKLWRSRLDDGGPGSFYASRLDRALKYEETEQGLAETLAADTAAELEQLLARQVEVERQVRDKAQGPTATTDLGWAELS